MPIEISDNAKNDLNAMDNSFKKIFMKAIDKIDFRESHKHLLFGLPYNVKKVSKQSRIIFEIYQNKIYIIHCFQTHKQYEKWFKSFS